MIIDIRAHHISLLAEAHFSGPYSGNNETSKIYKMIMDHPMETTIRVVEGFDYICNELCKAPPLGPYSKVGQNCQDDGFEDRRAREAIGLDIGQTFSWPEMVARFEEFRMRTGVTSPRDLFVQCKRYSFERNAFI